MMCWLLPPAPAAQGEANAGGLNASANPWRRSSHQVVLEVAWEEGEEPQPSALAALDAVERALAVDLPEVLTTGCAF